jgi:hypothetical protein
MREPPEKAPRRPPGLLQQLMLVYRMRTYERLRVVGHHTLSSI